MSPPCRRGLRRNIERLFVVTVGQGPVGAPEGDDIESSRTFLESCHASSF